MINHLLCCVGTSSFRNICGRSALTLWRTTFLWKFWRSMEAVKALNIAMMTHQSMQLVWNRLNKRQMQRSESNIVSKCDSTATTNLGHASMQKTKHPFLNACQRISTREEIPAPACILIVFSHFHVQSQLYSLTATCIHLKIIITITTVINIICIHSHLLIKLHSIQPSWTIREECIWSEGRVSTGGSHCQVWQNKNNVHCAVSVAW